MWLDQDICFFFFFSRRRRHTRLQGDWSSDVCSSDLAEGHCRHKKQTGGAGQFGEVFLRVEPLPRGKGYEFVDKVKGGVIPNVFIPAVEKGVRMALDSGVIAGYPVHDIRVTVYDVKHHALDSKEVAFVSAGRKAVIDAFSKAGAIVLEPIVNIEIAAPDKFMGDLTSDLSGKRGQEHTSELQSPCNLVCRLLLEKKKKP